MVTYEKGIGYNKSFSTGKSVNVSTNIPENPLEIWEYGSVIYAPGVLGAIETIGAVISIFD